MSDGDLFRVPVGPGTLHVERYGFGGAPILLIHGFATSSFLWRHVAPRLATGQATAFSVDLLGYGESDRPFPADFGVAAQAAYLDLALTALRVNSATIVGVDIGAIIALRLAFDRPERVQRLVLISPPALEEFPPKELRDLQRASGRYALSLNRSLLGAMPLFSEYLESLVGEKEHMPQTLVGRYLAPYLGREGLAHLQTLVRSLEDDELDDLNPAEIGQPALVLRGTRDRHCDRSQAESLAKALPQGSFAEVLGVGRLIPEESPAELAGWLLSPNELLRQAGPRAVETS
ncbi:MAG: alpha/beta hydrolase [Gemmatimonadaceae bacterium]